MSILSQIACTPCEAGEPPASEEEIAELHPFIPSWQIVHEADGRKLRNTFLFDDEKTAQAFLSYLEEVSRKENHHPDLDCRGTEVTVSWWTHSLGDLHPNDFIMAGKTDGAYTLAAVGSEGDMFTNEPLPTLADLPRFRNTEVGRRKAKRREKSA